MENRESLEYGFRLALAGYRIHINLDDTWVAFHWNGDSRFGGIVTPEFVNGVRTGGGTVIDERKVAEYGI